MHKINLKFIFKGGTALLLLLNKIHRFSIDIDIIMENEINDNDISNIVSISQKFNRFEKDIRKNNSIKKSHYKFFYNSVIDNSEKYIILDILFEKNPYDILIEKKLLCDFLKTNTSNINVKIPDINNILGDKLTAFAPNTTGVPYNKNKELEIIKQLFDISNLFIENISVEQVKKSFIKIADTELQYRNMFNINYKHVLDDMFDTSLIIAYEGKYKKEHYLNLLDGIRRIGSHIISSRFNPKQAILCAGRTAYLSTLLKNNIALEYYNPDINISKFHIDKNLNPLKKLNPEAFYYWYKSIENNQ